jgi:hypothetical protein
VTDVEYLAVLDGLHQRLRPRTYVEIGVRFGTSLRLALPGTTAIGIDPDADIRYPVPRGTRVFNSTSDDLFAEHDLRALLGGQAVDMAFIDGMHLFEYALRDFMHLEAECRPSSLILVHDCYPIDAATAARERTTKLWSGDVWKLTLLLRRHRPDLKLVTLDASPTGLAMITNLDPASNVLAERLDDLVAEYRDLSFGAIAEDKAEQLNRVDADWDHVEALLPPPFRTGNRFVLRAGRALRTPTAAQWRHRLQRLQRSA